MPTNARLLAERLATFTTPGHPARIAIDGFCAAGKTTLADQLAEHLRSSGRHVIRASGDDFQNPREVRWQLGPRSGEGFRRYTMDFSAICRELLVPLGPGGTLRYRTSVYDVFASRPNLGPIETARTDDIVVVDGLFLHASELRNQFDLSVFLATDFETCLRRAIVRRQERIDDPAEIEKLYRERYIPGWQIYLREVEPAAVATVVI